MIVPATTENIAEAASRLLLGDLIAFPTETVYGLGGDARNPAAVNRIYQMKGRPATNPLIVHVGSVEQMTSVAKLATQHRFLLAQLRQFFPGPLTVVLPKKTSLPAIVTAGNDSVAVRIPSHPVARALLECVDIPVAAPSANRSTRISPTSAQDVRDELGEHLMILDGGACDLGLESTVLSLINTEPTILRPGMVTKEVLEEVLGIEVKVENFAATSTDLHSSPGQQQLHYAPQTPTFFLPECSDQQELSAAAVVLFSGAREEEFRCACKELRLLSHTGSLEEVARSLYSVLRELDTLQLDAIYVEKCTRAGLGSALFDRLVRAVCKRR